MISRIRSHAWLVLLSVILLFGCASKPPLEDYSLARSALEAAREQDAARFAPNYWHRAEDAYHRGEQQYRDEDYKSATASFRESRQFAEKSENAARLQKFKTGEAVP